MNISMWNIEGCFSTSSKLAFNRQALFELQHITDNPKVYMRTNKDDSDKIFNDGGEEDSNLLTQD